MEWRTDAVYVSAEDVSAAPAAGILREALAKRTGRAVCGAPAQGSLAITLLTLADEADEDAFYIRDTETGFAFCAKGVRGLIYAVGLFLRKCVFGEGKLRLTAPIAGEYRPAKPIRGHQLGYRPINNTYDKWDEADFRKYMIELMYFGMNTVEFIPFTEQNAFMKLSGPEMTRRLSAAAHALGLRVSLWIPNGRNAEADELAAREELFRDVPYIDEVFVPGSDPGDLPAEELIDRCIKIQKILVKYHPAARLWPSAQAPHDAPGWGDAFLKALAEKDGGEIAGVITGPNRAFDIDVLRKKLPQKYPIRFYPDITHNLRCEHPVHFEKDDWHYAFAAALSRESVNPRPLEYERLFRTVAPFTVGSVTYSDGVNDDVNKALWCALEWDPAQNAEQIVSDYARAYLYGYDADRSAAGIFMLERNWAGSPAETLIDRTYHLLHAEQKEACNAWRFTALLFRAACDKYVKERYLAETAAAGTAKAMLTAGDKTAARAALTAPLPAHVCALRSELDTLAKELFSAIGMQLSVEDYGASGWERGATLDTVDLPITDKQWLKHLLDTAPDDDTIARAIAMNDVSADEAWFSAALHWPEGLGAAQSPGVYVNVLGDRPDVNDGTLPVCLQKVYDHYDLCWRPQGLRAGAAYRIRAVYYKPTERFLNNHTAAVNGAPLAPPQKDEAFTALLPRDFSAWTYAVPAGAVRRDDTEIVIKEPERGFQLAELFMIR